MNTYQYVAPNGDKSEKIEMEMTPEEIKSEMTARRQRLGKYSDGTPCCGKPNPRAMVDWGSAPST